MEPANDRDAISDLVHRYSDAVTRRDIAQWSACWSDSATWTWPSRSAVGRDAIVALLHHALDSLDAVVQNVLHGALSSDADGVRGQWYIIEHVRRVSGDAGLLLARYDDTYVCQDGHWLFDRRILVPSYQGPPDLSGTFYPVNLKPEEAPT